MQRISASILERTKAVGRQVDELETSASYASINAHNAFNKLRMLSFSQFVENVRAPGLPSLVQDVPEEAPRERAPDNGNGQESFRVLDEEELAKRYQVAYTNGQESLRAVIEDREPRPLAEKAMDLSEYGERLLPYIIGTPSYNQDENCGLFVSDSEGEDDELKVGGCLSPTDHPC
eukprot:scaffold346_cov387-Prasinococcus_capsulatus_cf.AAC.18